MSRVIRMSPILILLVAVLGCGEGRPSRSESLALTPDLGGDAGEVKKGGVAVTRRQITVSMKFCQNRRRQAHIA